ncbi:hypothetical protein G9A89_013162 [Geosiphon pyriformis]|nr:hypothetical protein G9A89_013162 [Geosiphon pyriformis]
MEFKIEDQVLLHCTKAEKQWSEKFDPKILKKVTHGNRLKIYHVKQESLLSVPQLGTQILLIRPEDIPQDLEPIIIIKTQYWKKNCLWAEGGKERGKEQEKDYKRKYLVPKLEKIKKALARGTKLPKTGEWTSDNAQK